MKKIVKLLSIPLFIAVVFAACKKDENKDYFVGGANPVLSASSTATIPLSFINTDAFGVKFMWTNPEYQFTTGVSSLNVVYLLEIDTTGANFTNPNRQSISISKDLDLTLTQGKLNDYLLNQLQLKPGMSHNLEVRVTASLNGSVPRVSNVLKFKVTPFAIPPKVVPPAAGRLYITGSATPSGWANPVPLPSQEFTQLSTTLYEITLPLSGGANYLFIPVNGDWSHKYAAFDGSQPWTGGDFKYDSGPDLTGPPASGNYKIQVDFQRGKYTVTPQ